jgi:AraC-like DNA-binding protein
LNPGERWFLVSAQKQGLGCQGAEKLVSVMRFSTEAFAATDRLEAFSEDFASQVANLNVRRLDEPGWAPFCSISAAADLGGVKMTDCAGSPIEFSRGKKQLADGDDHFTFVVNSKGSMRVLQKDAVISSREPCLMVIDHTLQAQVQCAYDQLLPANDHLNHRAFAFVVPRETLRYAVPNLEAYVGVPFQQKPVILEHLLQYSDGLIRTCERSNDAALSRAMGDHVFDLLVMLLGPTKDAAHLASHRGLKSARLHAILAFIERHLDAPGLNSQMIASHYGISRRYVFQLMEENGETLSRHVLRRRLEKAAAMSSNPVTEHMRISDIAYACGFNDLSNFSREFKRQFGDSPRSFRTQKASFAV